MTTNTLAHTQNGERKIYRTPRVNVIEAATAYTIEAEMPGVPGDAIEVQIEDQTLTVTGERVRPEGARLTSQRTDGYRRAFTLGDGIDGANVEASASDGILTITLPKVAERVPRKIDVRLN